jgi:energy-coupling factor transporter transmembrane protein EcfT
LFAFFLFLVACFLSSLLRSLLSFFLTIFLTCLLASFPVSSLLSFFRFFYLSSFSQLLPLCEISLENISVTSNVREIDRHCTVLLSNIESRQVDPHLSVDSEWDVLKVGGRINGNNPVSVIQIGFYMKESEGDGDGDGDSDGEYYALIFQVGKLRKIPEMLLKLLTDPDIVFVGKQIGGDFSKISTKFGLKSNEIIKPAKVVELGIFAKDRGVVETGKSTLRNNRDKYAFIFEQ